MLDFFWPESGICYAFSSKHGCVLSHFCRITEKRRSRSPIVNSQKGAFTIGDAAKLAILGSINAQSFVNAFKWGQRTDL